MGLIFPIQHLEKHYEAVPLFHTRLFYFQKFSAIAQAFDVSFISK